MTALRWFALPRGQPLLISNSPPPRTPDSPTRAPSALTPVPKPVLQVQEGGVSICSRVDVVGTSAEDPGEPD